MFGCLFKAGDIGIASYLDLNVYNPFGAVSALQIIVHGVNHIHHFLVAAFNRSSKWANFALHTLIFNNSDCFINPFVRMLVLYNRYNLQRSIYKKLVH